MTLGNSQSSRVSFSLSVKWGIWTRSEVNKLKPTSKFCLLPVFINKVLLEHSHAHLFLYYLGPLSCHKGRAEYLWQRPNGPQRWKQLLSVPLQESLPAPDQMVPSPFPPLADPQRQRMQPRHVQRHRRGRSKRWTSQDASHCFADAASSVTVAYGGLIHSQVELLKTIRLHEGSKWFHHPDIGDSERPSSSLSESVSI